MHKIDKLVLFPEYQKLWNTMEIRKQVRKEIYTITTNILANDARYMEVATKFKMPWQLLGAIHSLESSLNFTTHLANGDPLARRTVNVPKGRPKVGTGPFKWEVSAMDALTLQGANLVEEWDIPNCLYFAEKWNGFGYRLYHPSVKTPYLWSGTTHYTKGKYASDGKWSTDLVSKQIGVAVLLKSLDFSPT